MQAHIRPLSLGPKHHFYGYYGINPWDRSGRLHIALEIQDDSHAPTVGQVATLGVVDKAGGDFSPLAETQGWNLQQGCMAHWVQCQGQDMLSANDLIHGQCVTRIIDLHGQEQCRYEQGLCALSLDRQHAYALDFARMYHCRSVVGYTNHADAIEAVPEDNGIFHFYLKQQQSDLLISIAEVLRKSSVQIPSDARVWINHVLPNPSDEKIVFVLRYTCRDQFKTSLWSLNSDGSGLCEQIPFGGRVSHFCWRDDETLIVSMDDLGRSEMRFFQLQIEQRAYRPYGGAALLGDSHLCFNPTASLAVGDRYPDQVGMSDLFLFDPQTQARQELGRFHHIAHYRGDIRCDLHPRWSADGGCISFDSIHEGSRQIYLLELDAG